jgi:hypothetical protein
MEQRNLYVDEDLQWLQKSHERWLLQGDQNTNPFHRLANEWKNKNTILYLKDVDIEGIDGLLNNATNFLKSFLVLQPVTCLLCLLICILKLRNYVWKIMTTRLNLLCYPWM